MRLMSNTLKICFLGLSVCLFLAARVAAQPSSYLVLVDPGKDDEFLPAAKAMAALHDAPVKRFDPAKLDATLAELRKAPPRFVVFVLPPEKIDVDLAHAILEMATKVDDDPFVDFEYGYITGRDGPAAMRFVKRIEQAWKREFGGKAAFLGSWEGSVTPSEGRQTAMKALGLSAKQRYVKVGDTDEVRRKAARQALADCTGSDALVFMSHGYPDRMEHCFRTKDLQEWKTDLSPAILFNCACFNGAPGRWFEPKAEGYEDRGILPRDDSVALALLDSGIAGYFAGVDAWHGPLTMQVFYYVADDGMRLGEAANAMYNRLALEFLPERIHFEPIAQTKRGGKDAWVQNQRQNGAAMILYGDPALAPFAKRAKRLMSASAETLANDRLGVKLELRPLVDGPPGEDFIFPTFRLDDYFSLRSDPEKAPPQLEIYRVVPLPAQFKKEPVLKVVSAKSGNKDIPTGKPQQVVEDTPGGKLLHVRVPIQISLSDSFVERMRLVALATQGMKMELEGEVNK
jgi:Peptidase family C25